MNYNKACDMMELDPSIQITLDMLKKKYRIQALKYHPDKNKSPDSVSQFQDIHESFEFIKKHIVLFREFDDTDDDDDEHDDDDDILNEKTEYNTFLFTFIRNLFENEKFKVIITNITTLCEEKSLEYLKNMDHIVLLQKIHSFVILFKDVLHFSDSFIENIRIIISDLIKKKSIHEINVEVTLDDLFENNIYKYNFAHNGTVYLIPVWHHELIYDLSDGGEMRITCSPKIEQENVKIDTENNILVDICVDVREILGKGKLEFFLGKKKCEIDSTLINVIHHQTIKLKQCGISKPDINDIYNINSSSDIIVSLSIFCRRGGVEDEAWMLNSEVEV